MLFSKEETVSALLSLFITQGTLSANTYHESGNARDSSINSELYQTATRSSGNLFANHYSHQQPLVRRKEQTSMCGRRVRENKMQKEGESRIRRIQACSFQLWDLHRLLVCPPPDTPVVSLWGMTMI